MAQGYVEEAERRLRTVKTAVKEEGYAYAVRQAQECVELALKACLRMVGIEYPKVHDVGGLLKKEKLRFPEWFAKETRKLAQISKSLAKKREPAMYSVEVSVSLPGMLFSSQDAEKSLKDAQIVLDLAKRLVTY